MLTVERAVTVWEGIGFLKVVIQKVFASLVSPVMKGWEPASNYDLILMFRPGLLMLALNDLATRSTLNIPTYALKKRVPNAEII